MFLPLKAVAFLSMWSLLKCYPGVQIKDKRGEGTKISMGVGNVEVASSLPDSLSFALFFSFAALNLASLHAI